jgi:hypothetical protein
VGPGSPSAHARQRAILGRAAGPRLVAGDLGVAGLAIGLPLSLDPLVLGGILLIGLTLGSGAVLLARAVQLGLAEGIGPGPAGVGPRGAAGSDA